MKKSMLIILTFATLATHQLYPMDMLRTLPIAFYDYFKACDPYKTALVATISLLVIDRIYPIFPQLKRIQHPITTHDLTFLKSNFLVNMEGYSKDVVAPYIDERIKNIPKFDIVVLDTYVTQQAFNEHLENKIASTVAAIEARFGKFVSYETFKEKVDYFELENEGVQKFLRDDYKKDIDDLSERINSIAIRKPLSKLSLDKNSMDMYEITGSAEVQIALNLMRRKLKKMKQTMNEFKAACLSTVARNEEFEFNLNEFGSGASTPRLGDSLTPQSGGSFTDLNELRQESPRPTDEEVETEVNEKNPDSVANDENTDSTSNDEAIVPDEEN